MKTDPFLSVNLNTLEQLIENLSVGGPSSHQSRVSESISINMACDKVAAGVEGDDAHKLVNQIRDFASEALNLKVPSISPADPAKIAHFQQLARGALALLRKRLRTSGTI